MCGRWEPMRPVRVRIRAIFIDCTGMYRRVAYTNVPVYWVRICRLLFTGPYT
ncbi:hypothetical protein G1C95_1248 [Bifidobacterium sp. DSM 109957]|uniref:Uncharacterized protein n=1 Tax=Bifidobacterium oedipodis TaxID=2675322 RepID=A0A7Y0ERM0_9BIFI|nr:hypothetical protein [Bifidobacterium sp. DSM 109957]